MNQSLVLASFAFVVVGVSFLRLLREQEFFRLTAMKRSWGRVTGLALHFVANVGLPLIVGIFFLAQGVVGYSISPTSQGRVGLPFIELISQARHAAQLEMLMLSETEPQVDEHWYRGEYSQIY